MCPVPGVQSTPKGPVKEEVWVRNFEGPYSYPNSIASDLAELMACYSAANLNHINIDHLLDKENYASDSE